MFIALYLVIVRLPKMKFLSVIFAFIFDVGKSVSTGVTDKLDSVIIGIVI